MGGRKATTGSAGLSHHLQDASLNHSLCFQEQISRLASETSSNKVEAPPSSVPPTEPKPPSPSVGRQQKDDPSRRYTIVKQDEFQNERPRFPTSPYAARISSFNIDSPPDAASLFQVPKSSPTRIYPKIRLISRCTMRSYMVIAVLLLLPSTRRWTNSCQC